MTFNKEEVRRLCQKAGLRQRDLARLTGLSNSRLSNYMCGRRQPDAEVVTRIAQALSQDGSTLDLWLRKPLHEIKKAPNLVDQITGFLLSNENMIRGWVAALDNIENEDASLIDTGTLKAVKIALKLNEAGEQIPKEAWKSIINNPDETVA